MSGMLPQKKCMKSRRDTKKTRLPSEFTENFFHQKQQPGHSLPIRLLSHFDLSGKHDIKKVRFRNESGNGLHP